MVAGWHGAVLLGLRGSLNPRECHMCNAFNDATDFLVCNSCALAPRKALSSAFKRVKVCQ